MPTFCIHHLLHIEVSGSGEAIEVIKEFLSEFSVECHHPADTLFVSSEYDESQPAVKILSSDYRKNSSVYRFENSENGLKLYVPTGIVNQQEARHHVQVLMRFALISQELSLVKAAALSYQGRGILVSGIRSSGKTSAALLPLFDKSFRFLSDDTSIIGKDGTIWSFPRQLLLRHYQFNKNK